MGPLAAHIFCDESKARGFVLAAVVVEPSDLGRLRSEVGALRLPRQRRLHFATESDGRRRAIIKHFGTTGVSAVIYDGSGYRDGKAARDAVIGQLADDAAAMGADRLILELDDSVAASDRAIIRERLLKVGRHHSLRYEHRRAHEECLLAIPDAIAWCWVKGGHWRRFADAIVTDVVRL
jgi:hypothetical protein